MIGPQDRLLHYRIVEKIGAGGMGEVWRARDESLDRDVAIKVLPPDLAADADRLARFEREAKLLASLNHPHIAAVYGLHEDRGIRFLAMEMVPGVNLRAHLVERPLALEDALDLARQVAEALEAAHDNGVVHRDLKPENIQINPDGQAKVLDFGLAKAMVPEGGASGLSHSPTITAGTRDGVILGTAAYMSPEQAKGKSVDRRADIWAFGAVLHEMLTGKMLFGAETVTEVLAAVLTAPVDTEALPGATPAPVKRLILRCLDRDPRHRLRDIGEARVLLEDVAAGRLADRPPATPRGGSRGILPLAIVGSLVLGGVLGALFVGGRAGPAGPTRRFVTTLDILHGQVASPRISPDGRRLAYEYGDVLWVRPLDRFEPRQLAAMEGLSSPAWSPDGEWVAFLAEDRIFKVSVEGGEPVPVLRFGRSFDSNAGLSWGPDGDLVFASDDGIHQIASDGGEATILLRPGEEDLDFHDPVHVPNGILFVVHRPRFENRRGGPDTLAVLTGGERRDILTVDGRELRWPFLAPSGFLLFTAASADGEDRPIWAVRLDPATLRPRGEPFTVSPSGREPTVSADGTLVYASTSLYVPRRRLVVLDEQGEPVHEVGEPRRALAYGHLSPDAGRVALVVREEGRFDTHVLDLDQGILTRLSFAAGVTVPGGWFPGGEDLLVGEQLGTEAATYYRARADGSDKQAVFGLPGGFLPELAPDGRDLVFVLRREGEQDLWRVPLDEPGAAPEPLLEGPAQEWAPAFSPDGRYLAYRSDLSGSPEVYLTRYPSGEGRWQISRDGGDVPRWSPEGDRLYYMRGSELMVVDVELDPVPRTGRPRVVASAGEMLSGVRIYEPLPGGQILFARDVPRSPDEEKPPQIFVVENWSPTE